MLPKIENYGKYSTSNYGAHTLIVSIGNLSVYFSYSTPVAFSTSHHGLICSENIWGNTTGKHLNWIMPDKKKRIKNDMFEARLKDVIASFSI